MSEEKKNQPSERPQGKPKENKPLNEETKYKGNWIGESQEHQEQLRKAAEIPPKPKNDTDSSK